MHAVIVRGKNKGKKLFPHKHKDGNYVVSATRFERDYIRLTKLAEVESYVAKGYGLRMSNPKEGIPSASLISSSSIRR